MKKFHLTIICFLFSILTNSTSAKPLPDKSPSQIKERIIWLYEDIKENMALESYSQFSPDKYSSPSVYTEKLILSKLKQYDIKLKKTSIKRINLEIKNSTNTCAASRIKTPKRREFSFFSTPQNIYLSHRLYRLENKTPLSRKLFNDQGEIKSLQNFFSHLPTSVLGTGDDVSYGDFLDKELVKLSTKNIYQRGGGKRIYALNEMLFRDRVDFILFYPSDINLIANPTNRRLESYPISENPPYSLGYFSCSKSEFGQKVITEINKILAEAYTKNNFHQVYQQWLLPADMVELDQYYDDVFTQR